MEETFPLFDVPHIKKFLLNVYKIGGKNKKVDWAKSSIEFAITYQICNNVDLPQESF